LCCHPQAVSVASRDSMSFSEFSDFFETVFVDQPVSREFVAAAQLDSYLDGMTHTYTLSVLVSVTWLTWCDTHTHTLP